MLTVYKASAGSGKTFTLTIEYIKMLINNPMSYRNILAVTFTNKATDEMKSRILTKLYGMWKQLADSADYTSKISQDLGLSPAIVAERAGQALTLLVHHYNHFRVVTIDTFFQIVLRNLARELDLTANMRIELGDTQIEQQAVDRMIESLRPTDELLVWIMQYITDTINDDKNWNVIRHIKDFGRNIFKDFYKEHSDTLETTIGEATFFERYTSTLRTLAKNAEQRMKNVADEFFAALDGAGFTIDDLASKSRGAASFFIKLQRGDYGPSAFNDKKTGELLSTYQKALADPDAWLTKTALKGPNGPLLKALAHDKLTPLLEKAESTRRREWNNYQASQEVLAHMHQLRLLGSIAQAVREDNIQHNRFLLSDTQYMLHRLIGQDDTPFIYEKIGTQINHIMIDEFQDTSTIQWANFKVLLLECLSHEDSGTNLIVGDVKQSIYRWREGDWRLLNNIDAQFKDTPYTPHEDSLKTNYRSERNIIDFNNSFFTHAAMLERQRIADAGSDMMAAQLEKAYSDVVQLIPANRPRPKVGRIEVQLLPRQADDETDTTTLMMERVTATISRLLSEHVRPRDIAVLMRRNEDVRTIARYLSDHLPDVPVVSGEAYRLDSSIAVNAIIWSLRLLLHPTDEIMQANVACFYKKYVERGVQEDKKNRTSNEEKGFAGREESFVRKEESFAGREKSFIRKEESLISNEAEGSKNNEAEGSKSFAITSAAASQIADRLLFGDTDLSALPLFELAEHLQRLYKLDEIEGQSAFVCAFFDVINKFAIDNPSDIEGFLEQWDNSYCDLTIQTDDADGIQLLSIHKSKGLEYDNVIIPFCDWKMTLPGLIWCQPRTAPFNELPLVAVSNIVSRMAGTCFEHDCLEESFENIIDNLNMLYVAFTRAGKNLFVYGRRADQQYRSNLLEQCLPLIAADLEGAEFEGAGGPDDEVSFAYGTIAKKEEKGEKGEKKEEGGEGKEQGEGSKKEAQEGEEAGEEHSRLSAPKPKQANVFLAEKERIDIDFNTYPSKATFRQSNDSREFVKGEDEEQQISYIKKGNIMHGIFSEMRTADDLPKVMKSYVERGLLADAPITPEAITSLMSSRLACRQAADWFAPGWRLYNECTILTRDPNDPDKMKEYRPDRVMERDGRFVVVDFKFASPTDEHKQQVGLYMAMLKQMGHNDVEGYLWYVYPNRIVKC